MSDHKHSGHGHDPDGGARGAGHEMDVPPTKELFNIIWGLGALTLLSLATCVQLFNNQQRDIAAERGKEAPAVLAQYRQGMDAITRSAGEVNFKDSTGAEVKQRYVPLAVARELVLSKPERLLAAPPPVGWMHPDDIAAGGQGGAAAAPAPAPPAPAVPAPTDIAPGPDGAPTGAGMPAGAGTPAPNPPAIAPAPATPPGQPAADPGKSAPAAPTPAPASAPVPAPAH